MLSLALKSKGRVAPCFCVQANAVLLRLGQGSEGPARGPMLLVTIIQITGTSVMQGPVLLLAQRPLRITQATGTLLLSLSGLKCCAHLQELCSDTRCHFRVQAGSEFWKVIEIEKCKLIESSNASSYQKCIGSYTTNSRFSRCPFLCFSRHFRSWLLGMCWLIWSSQ